MKKIPRTTEDIVTNLVIILRIFIYMEMIPIDWYIQSPIDFEHKQYVLFAYLQRVDSTYLNKIVSPHLLHLEKLETEILGFKKNLKDLESDLKKQRYLYFDNDPKNVFDNDKIKELVDIVEFSIPQIHSRIQIGYKIANKYKQVIY